MVTETDDIIFVRSCASEANFASLRRCDSFTCRTILRFESVAGMAKPRGNRKLRAYPGATFTVSPGCPSFSTSALSMTSMACSLECGRERHQSDVPRLLDRFRQTALVRGTHARDTAGRDLAAFADEASQQTDVFVVDVVDFVDAESAHLLA